MMRRTPFYKFIISDDASSEEEVEFREENSPPQFRDLIGQWPVKKVLSGRDIQNGQVVLPKRQVVENDILARLLPDKQNSVNRPRKKITVRDLDTLTEHTMFLWVNGSSSYVLTEGWSSIVNCRGLEVGEEVGFCWDERLGVLRFTVLSRPPVPRQD
ncbi:hypothetical protein NE237_013166 [Protea cynaroides]|uniref:TF-B3 domain-containing protein n=1 Tax=Protea cynaroides TaxID=273540 RepID=A0A9Q0GYT5_9MAGN|nr:hypothetical protein NE237_013166 [Protea cynaroides]